ncbi:PQQ-binding-like beta-propeller repeat protein [Alicyclobacillus sp. SP_1]|uniref:outer membrane protein assembly factor BamB family protein n=1 Tax=Alicyclobacillus sp. SP_1 TaxID=2942475 RepID=UPI002157D194|nr:PQQ-binding-like beta-propeller repeat protein [Alicyclobacillus sp. SP_1]
MTTDMDFDFFGSGPPDGPSKKSKAKKWWILLAAVVAAVLIALISLRNEILNSPLLNAYPRQWQQYGLNAHHTSSWYHSTEHENWIYTLKGESHGGGSIVDGTYFIGDNSGDVTAIQVTTGKARWVTHVADNNIMTVPLVYQGRVFVGVGNNQFQPGHLIRGTGVNEIVALSEKTGRILWTVKTSGEDMPTFIVHQNVLYALGGDGVLRALRPSSGQVLWTLSLGGVDSMSSPVIVHHLLFAGMSSPYRTVAVNLETHRLAFQTPFPKAVAAVDDASIVYGDGKVYQQWVERKAGSKTEYRQNLTAINATNGHVVWTYYEPYGVKQTPQDYEAAAPVYNKGILYFGSSFHKQLYAISASNGQLLWNYQLSSAANETPVLTTNNVLIGDVQGNLYALDQLTGFPIGMKSYQGQIFLNADPVYCNGVLFVPMASRSASGSPQAYVRAIPLSRFSGK